MLITIRQGIVSVQPTPTFITFGAGVVNLNADTEPTIITFADSKVDYLFTESQSINGAWPGPFAAGNDYYLYWDIDKNTGVRTFGTTTVTPSFGQTRPTVPVNDQHFFDTKLNQMLVWGGGRWVAKLRIFAGVLQGGLLIPEPVGSQINVNQQRNVGHILYDADASPIKRANGLFVTTETPLNASNNPENSYKLEAKQVRARALETIPKFHGVTWRGPNRIGMASSANPDLGKAIGISVEDIIKNEVKNFVTDGYIINEEWNFTQPPGTLLFVGRTGEVTTTVPQKDSMQRIGQVVDENTAFIRIEPLFRLDSVPVSLTPLPTMTATPSVTPSVTPSLSVSQTPLVSPTPNPTPTGTPGPTVTSTNAS